MLEGAVGDNELEKRLASLSINSDAADAQQMTDQQVQKLWQAQQDEFMDLHSRNEQLISETLESMCEKSSEQFRVFRETAFSIQQKRQYLTFREAVLDKVNLFLLNRGPYRTPHLFEKVGANITRVPDDFFIDFPNIDKLQSINLSSNKIRKISSKISLAKNLVKLELHNNLLQSIPVEVFALNQLTRLKLGHNLLLKLPEQLEQLAHLEYLDVHNNKLCAANFPLGILEKSSISFFHLFHNPNAYCPEYDHVLLREALILLRHKTEILIQLAKIKESFHVAAKAHFSELEALFQKQNTAENKINSQLYECINAINSLIITSRIHDNDQILECNNAHITRFVVTEEDYQQHIDFWNKVRYVNLSHNHLASFDANKVKMPSLNGLFLTHNRIRVVKNLKRLKSVGVINLSYNQLVNLPNVQELPEMPHHTTSVGSPLDAPAESKYKMLLFSFNPLTESLLAKVAKDFLIPNGLKDRPLDKVAAQWRAEANEREGVLRF